MQANMKITGFTLIELLVTLAVFAIVLSTAVPGFGSLIASNRITTQANTLVTALNQARSEAISRGVSIDIVATTALDEDNEWGSGWRVEIAGGETLLVFDGLGNGYTLDSAADLATLRYNPNGRIATTDTLTLCDSNRGGPGRSIAITATGRISTSEIDCS